MTRKLYNDEGVWIGIWSRNNLSDEPSDEPLDPFETEDSRRVSCQYCGQPGEHFSVCKNCGGATSKTNTGSKTNMREALEKYKGTTDFWQAREEARKFAQNCIVLPPRPNPSRPDMPVIKNSMSEKTFWAVMAGIAILLGYILITYV